MSLLQETGKGTSDVPMITGVLGFVATIPGTFCAGACSICTSTAETLATGTSSGIASIWLLLNVVAGVAALVFGIRSKSTPRLSGAVMLFSALLTLMLDFITLNWFWGLIAVACFAVGGAVSFTQEKSNV